MAVCATAHCNNTVRKGFVLVRFPKENTVRERWESLLGRPGWRSNVNNTLCEVHFERDSWTLYRRKLKDGAIPTKFCTCGYNIPRKSCRPIKHAEHPYPKTATQKSRKTVECRLLKNYEHFSTKARWDGQANELTNMAKPSTSACLQKKQSLSNCPCRQSHLRSCVP